MIFQNSTRFTPEHRVASFYFFQFMSVGAANAFAGIWFANKGLSPEQIGFLYSAPVMLLLIVSLTVGRIADRASDWREVIIVGAVLSGLFPIGLFFVSGFWGILFFWTFAVATQWGTTPVVDAAAMRLSRRRGYDFGAFRAWGTISSLVVTVAAGYLLKAFGVKFFLPLFVGLALARSASSLGLPKLRAGLNEEACKRGAGQLLHVMKPWFFLPLIGWSLVYSTHLVLNAFLGLVLKQQGFSTQAIGLFIALSALSEMALFFGFKRFASMYSARWLILLSCSVAVLRWIWMSFSPGLEVLVGLQLLHSITYALGFLACVNFISNWTNENIAAEAQGFFVVLQLAAGMVIVSGFGWLTNLYGAKAFLGSAAVCTVGALLVWLSLMIKPAGRGGTHSSKVRC
jgi:MFS transporter, PPP family, 3-phenylpropionic acid transporter